MAQLAERSLPLPEDPGLNPVIGKLLLNIYLLLTVSRKDENKEKRPGMAHFKKKLMAKVFGLSNLERCSRIKGDPCCPIIIVKDCSK